MCVRSRVLEIRIRCQIQYTDSCRLSSAIIDTLWPASPPPGLRVMEQSLEMLVTVKNGSSSLVSISSSDMVPAAASDHFMAIRQAFTAALDCVVARAVDRAGMSVCQMGSGQCASVVIQLRSNNVVVGYNSRAVQ